MYARLIITIKGNKMNTFLGYFAFIMLVTVICVLANEKITKIPPEIALLAFSLIIGIIFKALMLSGVMRPTGTVMETISTFRVDKLLMDALLCFMLFSGSSDLKFKNLFSNFKAISLLALLTTVITALVYGGLFYVVAMLLGINASFSLCVLLGAIVSPTDPIAATGILNKLGLPDDITEIMEGESLFNDGTGVALFIFVKAIVTDTKEQGFFAVMSRELIGAIVVGIIISFIGSQLIKITQNQVYHILISLLSVSACYVICSRFECSGVIASVICGIYFASVIEKYRQKGTLDTTVNYYDSFWSIVDKIFNYVLYVLIGISFVYVTRIKYMLILAVAAIVINFVARYAGVFVSTCIMRKVPAGYSVGQFTYLMTWSGLKGGLCLALVMSIIDVLPSAQYNVMLFIVFVTILFTTIVQGLTVAPLYLRLEKKVKKAQ